MSNRSEVLRGRLNFRLSLLRVLHVKLVDWRRRWRPWRLRTLALVLELEAIVAFLDQGSHLAVHGLGHRFAVVLALQNSGLHHALHHFRDDVRLQVESKLDSFALFVRVLLVGTLLAVIREPQPEISQLLAKFDHSVAITQLQKESWVFEEFVIQQLFNCRPVKNTSKRSSDYHKTH